MTKVDNSTMMGCALTTLAQVRLARGDLSTARRLLDRAIAIHPSQFQGVAQMFTHVNLGWVAIQQGDVVSAHTSLLAALRIGRDALGGRARLVTPLEGFAQLAAADGQPARALRLAGAASRLRRDYSTPPTPTEVQQLQHRLQRSRAAMSGADADATWSSGQRFTPEEALAEAMALELTHMHEHESAAKAWVAY